MTDQQLLVLSMSIIIPLSLLIYSNSRITEAKETLRAELTTLRTEMNGKHDTIIAGLDRIATLIETKLAMHELEHHK